MISSFGPPPVPSADELIAVANGMQSALTSLRTACLCLPWSALPADESTALTVALMAVYLRLGLDVQAWLSLVGMRVLLEMA